jgi:Sulfotransferase domain
VLTVIGAGLPRTGTTSMKAALERLGFGPCHHMFEIATHPEQVDRWLPLVNGPVDWEAVFEGYRSSQDWPSSHFWRDLVAAYPQAKVVLTVRDPLTWYPSLRELMLRGPGTATGTAEAPMATANQAIGRLAPVLSMIGQAYFGPDWRFGADLAEDVALAAYHRHEAAVRAGVPADRLLVFDVRQGWEPLCAFLGAPVPVDEPFPRLNDTQWMREAVERMKSGGAMPSPF